MLVAAGILTAQMEKIVARWKLEAGLPPVPGQKVFSDTTPQQDKPVEVPLFWQKEGYRILPDSELGPTVVGDTSFRGTFVVYDWDTKEIIWQENWGEMVNMSAGYCFADGVMYLNDLEGASVFVVDMTDQPGRLLRRMSHPYLNDLHSLERTRRGLLATCSGNDLIIELDLNGNSLYEWWAVEHGYNVSPSGKERTTGRDQEHRDQYYHTRYQTTHLNDATFRDPETERYLLALLFHQGQLVQIDRSLPPGQQQAEIILDGLARPHGLEKTPLGWLFCNSLSKELLLLDDDLKVIDRIEYDGGWIQDCTMLADGRILLNDVDNHRVVEHEGPPWRISNVIQYPQSWRMGEMLQVPPGYDEAFRRAGALAATAG